MAIVAPFPLAKRRTMIDRQAPYATSAAGRDIQHRLKIQADAGRRSSERESPATGDDGRAGTEPWDIEENTNHPTVRGRANG
jgi:hypothetical protein